MKLKNQNRLSKNKCDFDFNEALNELNNVIHKEGDHWKIRGHKGVGHNEKEGDWPQNFKTKKSAENALKAYHAHNH